ncbi:MAG: hypothetical protein DI635_03590 [Pseudoxanthomonas suwonensis]|nr:MAG: hypothetical protein DI635_03590 [Pseudoxanthomonas suwonensis]
MSEDSDGKSGHRWYHHLPPKLAAMVVFLVALTTLLGNLFELNEKRQHVVAPDAPAAAPPPAPVANPQQPAVAPIRAPVVTAPVPYRIAIDRIAVKQDGSPGTTDWRFTVVANGEPLFAFQQDGLNDVAGSNIAVPEQAHAKLRLLPGQTVTVTVQGWRLSRLRTPTDTPDVTGQAVVSGNEGSLPVVVKAAEDSGGSFTFYLDLQPMASATAATP